MLFEIRKKKENIYWFFKFKKKKNLIPELILWRNNLLIRLLKKKVLSYEKFSTLWNRKQNTEFQPNRLLRLIHSSTPGKDIPNLNLINIPSLGFHSFFLNTSSSENWQ